VSSVSGSKRSIANTTQLKVLQLTVAHDSPVNCFDSTSTVSCFVRKEIQGQWELEKGCLAAVVGTGSVVCALCSLFNDDGPVVAASVEIVLGPTSKV
jgi:hypothetical protein